MFLPRTRTFYVARDARRTPRRAQGGHPLGGPELGGFPKVVLPHPYPHTKIQCGPLNKGECMAPEEVNEQELLDRCVKILKALDGVEALVDQQMKLDRRRELSLAATKLDEARLWLWEYHAWMEPQVDDVEEPTTKTDTD